MSEGNVSADQLRLIIERKERLLEEKKGITDYIKVVDSEAKAMGFDVKTINAVIKMRGQENHVRQEAEALLEAYKAALGLE